MIELNQDVVNVFVSYLKTIKYKNKIQNLEIEYCTDDDGNYLKLILIKIKKSQRNKGYGSAVMYEICVLADFHNVRIKLWATNIYGADLKRLYEFYRKQGLVLNDNSNDGEMIYYPQKK